MKCFECWISGFKTWAFGSGVEEDDHTAIEGGADEVSWGSGEEQAQWVRSTVCYRCS